MDELREENHKKWVETQLEKNESFKKMKEEIEKERKVLVKLKIIVDEHEKVLNSQSTQIEKLEADLKRLKATNKKTINDFQASKEDYSKQDEKVEKISNKLNLSILSLQHHKEEENRKIEKKLEKKLEIAKKQILDDEILAKKLQEEEQKQIKEQIQNDRQIAFQLQQEIDSRRIFPWGRRPLRQLPPDDSDNNNQSGGFIPNLQQQDQTQQNRFPTTGDQTTETENGNMVIEIKRRHNIDGSCTIIKKTIDENGSVSIETTCSGGDVRLSDDHSIRKFITSTEKLVDLLSPENFRHIVRPNRYNTPTEDVESIPVHPNGINLTQLKDHSLEFEIKENINIPKGQSLCAICQLDFEIGDICRRLNCMDCFHSKCIEIWARVNAVCPCDKRRIKIRKIDEVFQKEDKETEEEEAGEVEIVIEVEEKKKKDEEEEEKVKDKEK